MRRVRGASPEPDIRPPHTVPQHQCRGLAPASANDWAAVPRPGRFRAVTRSMARGRPSRPIRAPYILTGHVHVAVLRLIVAGCDRPLFTPTINKYRVFVPAMQRAILPIRHLKLCVESRIFA